MRLFDLRYFEDRSPLETDLCIVGTGPAGTSIANEFATQNIRVLLVEGGDFDENSGSQSLYDIESAPPRKVDQKDLRCRALGGSSRIWTGRCAPFDVLDFEERSWVSRSGWPISSDDLSPYLERAASYLGLTPSNYDESLWGKFEVVRPLPSINEKLLRPMFWQFSRSPRNQKVSADFGRDILATNADNIQILLHANLTQINTKDDGAAFESIEVSTLDGKRIQIKSKALVLCCGGIENARLLLSSNHQHPKGVGNQNDVVGRFLTDHTDAAIWSLDQDEAHKLLSRFGTYWLDSEKGRHVFLHGLGLSGEVQEKEGLLNCHAYIDQFGTVDDDPWVALHEILPTLRSRCLPDLKQLAIVLMNLGELAAGLYRRWFIHRPPITRAQRFEIHCIIEQEPDPDSRVTLSESTRDALGMPLSKIAWNVGEKESKTVRRMCQLLSEEFSRLKLPAPVVPRWLDGKTGWVSRCTEKAHPSGTTRMATNAADGVVDENCQVHGVKGLFVSGSSVFPTPGAANPTLMIVAMSLRLADWLKSEYLGSKTESVAAPPLSTRYRHSVRESGQSKVKVGLVGAGSRMREVYLPILQQMSAKYQIIGFATGSKEGSLRFESNTGITGFLGARELVEQERPDLLIAAVPDRFSERAITDLIDLGIPIVAETPIAWSASGVRKIIEKASVKKVLLGVAEQFPFLPMEQFRKRLLDLGVFGEVYAAFNDFDSYSYHGIAQLRRYIKGNPKFVRNREARSGKIRWQSGSVLFDNGARIHHNYVMAGPSFGASVHFHGTNGAMRDGEITVIDANDRTEKLHITRDQTSAGHLKAISVTLPNIGEVRWDNPFSEFNFSDEQIAVASVVDGMSTAIQSETPLPYTVDQFLTDMEIVQALRISADGAGRNIRLPLQETKERVLSLTSPTYWKRKLFR